MPSAKASSLAQRQQSARQHTSFCRSLPVVGIRSIPDLCLHMGTARHWAGLPGIRSGWRQLGIAHRLMELRGGGLNAAPNTGSESWEDVIKRRTRELRERGEARTFLDVGVMLGLGNCLTRFAARRSGTQAASNRTAAGASSSSSSDVDAEEEEGEAERVQREEKLWGFSLPRSVQSSSRASLYPSGPCRPMLEGGWWPGREGERGKRGR
eukprot:3934199-Rhodomonas_salina.1